MIISRYIGCLKPNLPVFYSDFLVLGSGIAGLFTALKAAEYGQVIVLTKKSIKDSNTDMAQGGIAAAVNEEDSPFLHLEDTLEAGAGLCNINAVDVLVREGPERVRELMKAGAAFDMKNGSVDLTREGAHSRPRILHAADATGEAIRIALEQRCLENPRIEVKEQHFLVDLLGNQAGTECCGALVHNALNGDESLFVSRAVIVATGGAGQLYQYTTNPQVATADGMAACYRIGCELEDLEFIQFHPTVLYSTDNQRFLVSESVRGEGGILLDHAGRPFMSRYHHQGDLAPRDVVSRAILSELFSTGAEHVYLDMRHIHQVDRRFPNIYRACLAKGIDPLSELVPVSPAAHYTMGGVKTDLSGRTRIAGLYACGEVACTGVHGANRLASNSLLEGIVFGQRIIEQAEEILYRRLYNPREIYQQFDSNWIHRPAGRGLEPEQAADQLKQCMWENVGIIRSESGLIKANRRLEELYSALVPGENSLEYYQVINLLTVARVVVQAALWRKESRGAHYRADFDGRDDLHWKKHMSFINC